MAGFRLLVGLGNPGSEYENTRHNAGAQWIEALARMSQCSLRTEKKFFGEFGKVFIGGQEIVLTLFLGYAVLFSKSLAVPH